MTNKEIEHKNILRGELIDLAMDGQAGSDRVKEINKLLEDNVCEHESSNIACAVNHANHQQCTKCKKCGRYY